jgi:hypothetical protein
MRDRKIDYLFLAFFFLNILFITYIVDLEQLVIPDYGTFMGKGIYPPWPPKPFIDLVHWWGKNFDPVLLVRPVWWKATIWLDAILFGPFYIAAIYAFIRGRDWIRIPAIIQSSILFTNVTIILSEEIFGVWKSPDLARVLCANAPWFIFPFLIIARMWKEHPFTKPAEE